MSKIKVNNILLIFLLNGIAFTARAQETSELHWGIKLGTNSTWIKGLETTILSEPYFLSYNLDARPVFPFQKFPDKAISNKSIDKKTYFPLIAGGYVNYRFDNVLGFEGGAYFSQQRSYLVFQNFEKDFNYKIDFNYSYINIPFVFNFYPAGNKFDKNLERLSIDLGLEAGLNVGSENIKYQSWGLGVLPEFGTDLEQQQQLRNVLKGRSLLNFMGGLSYRFPGYKKGSRFSIGTHFVYSASDAVETQANSYDFTENRNNNYRVQFTLGFSFAKFDNNGYSN